jgi:hypothetical protein
MNSKNKGNSFERKIANLLSSRFELKTGIKKAFRRNADSGSFFGGSNQKRLETYDTEKASLGDVICPQTFVYTVECKHYKSAPLFKNIMQQECKEWDGWIKQAEQDSQNSGKKMLLIIKYNNVDEIVIATEPVPNAYNLPYKTYFVSSLSSCLAQDDSVFFD